MTIPNSFDSRSARLDVERRPDIDMKALVEYRLRRTREEMKQQDIPLCILTNPLSLRYVAEIRQFSMFQGRTPMIYLAVPVDGPVVLFGGYNVSSESSYGVIDEFRPARAVTVFMGGFEFSDQLQLFVGDMKALFHELDADHRRIAVENLSPLATRALIEDGYEVSDAQVIMERARISKCPQEIDCMRWSIATTELGIQKMKEALRPGVTENELWAVLNYVNLANDGEWADSRQLASGPNTNPFAIEACDREVEDGDLVSFDTDMIGPFGYCADISRTLHCGPSDPTAAQRDLYQRAYEQLQHNLELVKAGIGFDEIIERAYVPPPQYHCLPLIMHGIGMADEYPMLFFPEVGKSNRHRGSIEPGMTLCVEAYAARKDGGQGVKLEEQVLVTESGVDILTRYPFEVDLLY